jgi:hypothetical protein
VTTYLASGCAALDDPAIGIAFSTTAKYQETCAQWRGNVISDIEKSADIDVIVTTSVGWAYAKADDPSVKDTGDGYVKAWTRWLDSGKTVIVINDVPSFPTSVPECLATTRTVIDPCSIVADPLARFGPLAKAAKQISDPRFHFIDHWDVFCEAKRCSPVVGGIPAYIDSNHLTVPFARSFGRKFISAEAMTGDFKSMD